MWRLLRWLMGKRGDMVWNTLVIITVLLPLMGLTLDIPRYFILRSTLQNAVDAAAEAAAETVDAETLIYSGGQDLLASGAVQYAHMAFDAVAAPMRARGYNLTIDGIQIDESQDRVTVTAHGDIQYLFGLTPSVAIGARGESWFRSLHTTP